MMKKYAVKGLYLLIIGFFYLFARGVLTKILYPLENKYHLYLVIGDQTYNLIDCNIPHLVAFIGVGIFFGFWWGLAFVLLLEVFQKIIGGDFSKIDIVLNSAGLLIGIAIRYIYEKVRGIDRRLYGS